MEWYWTWGGKSFGYRRGDNLWTHDGRHVGRFHNAEVYGRDGLYLGEVKGKNRLITSLSKKGRRRSAFEPYAQEGSFVPYADYAGFVMYVGYEDFPDPSSL